MAITYPLSLPTHVTPRTVELTAVNAVAYSMSPFTFSGQAHAYAGQMWQVDITLPQMRREDANIWIAWLVSLKGQTGRFLIGDPTCTAPQGSANTSLGTPVITDQTGENIDVTGAATSQTNWLVAGDYIQIGAASTATLHQVLQNASTDASGNVTLEVWPGVRGTRSGSITVNNPVGNFRLASNQQSWNVSEASTYGITFGAMEAI